jgi:hypothetical protein
MSATEYADSDTPSSWPTCTPSTVRLGVGVRVADAEADAVVEEMLRAELDTEDIGVVTVDRAAHVVEQRRVARAADVADDADIDVLLQLGSDEVADVLPEDGAFSTDFSSKYHSSDRSPGLLRRVRVLRCLRSPRQTCDRACRRCGSARAGSGTGRAMTRATAARNSRSRLIQ